MGSHQTQSFAPSVNIVKRKGLELNLHSCLSHDELSDVWQLQIAPKLDLQDWSSLAKTDKTWYHAVAAEYSSPRARRLMGSLIACVSQLSSTRIPVLSRRIKEKMENFARAADVTQDNVSRRTLAQLWKVVLVLQHPTLRPWGPSTVAIPGLVQDYTQLFKVPSLPREIPEHLVQHTGVRMSYQQLLALAHECVAGVEVWVQLQHQLGLQTDIPDLAVKICCGTVNKANLDGWNPADASDLINQLQLALNGNVNGGTVALVCARTLSLMQSEAFAEVFTGSVVVRLLQTAILRGHLDALQLAISTRPVQQLRPNEILQLMQAVVSVHSEHSDYMSSFNMFQMMGLFAELPAAGMLDSEQLVSLMLVMYDLRAMLGIQSADMSALYSAMKALRTSPSARVLSVFRELSMRVEILATILRFGVHSWPDGDAVVEWMLPQGFCNLPPNPANCSKKTALLMQRAIARNVQSTYNVGGLCRWPAAQHLTIPDCVKFLWMLLVEDQHGQDPEVAAVCSLPGAIQMPVDEWLRIVEVAVEVLTTGQGLQALLKLPAASQASAEDIGQLFMIAAGHGSSNPEVFPGVVEALCAQFADRAPPLQAITLARAVVTQAAQGKDGIKDSTLAALGSLQAVQNMSATEVLALFYIAWQRGVPNHNSTVTWLHEWLFKLPGSLRHLRQW